MPSALTTDLSWKDLTSFGSDFNGQAIYTTLLNGSEQSFNFIGWLLVSKSVPNSKWL